MMLFGEGAEDCLKRLEELFGRLVVRIVNFQIVKERL